MLIYKKSLFLIMIIVLSFSVFGADFNIRNTSDTSQKYLSINGNNGIVNVSTSVHTPELCLNGNCQTNWSIFNSQDVDSLRFNQTPTMTCANASVGQLFYDVNDKALSYKVNGICLQIGEEQYVTVVNKLGFNISNGQVVYINGAQGNRPTVNLSDNLGENSSRLLGMMTQDCANNAECKVTVAGLVHDLNTASFNNGDIIYLSNQSGNITNVRPTSPNFGNMVGYVVNSHSTQGIVLIAINIKPTFAENSGIINYVIPVSNGSGGVNLSATSVYCYSAGMGTEPRLYNIPALNNQPLTDGINTANYVSIDCNTQSYLITSDKKDFVTSNGRYIRVSTIIRSGNNLHIESEPIYGDALTNRMEQRIMDTDEYKITDTTTLTMSVSTDWNVTHGAIEAYSGVYKDTIPATNSSERGFQVGHNSSGDWITTSATPPKLNYSHYDNGTGWQRYTTGYYGVCYYYMGVEVGQHVYFRCTQEYASQELAKASNQFPTIPTLISQHTVYVGRIIFQESNSSNVLIQTSSEVVGSATPVSNHNSLSGLQGGGSLGYYHLNDSQINILAPYSLISNLVSYVGNWSADKNNYYTKTETNDTIDAKLQTIVYYPSTNLTIYGTNVGGNNIGNLSFIDGQVYNVTEAAGANPLEVRINFTNVTTNFTTIQAYIKYVGSTGHELDLQLWDYNTNSWENYNTFTTTSSFILYQLPVADASTHISGGVVQLRINHLSPGQSGHYLMIDEVQLQKGISIQGSGSTSDPNKLNKDGSMSMTGNLTFTTGNGLNWSYVLNIPAYVINYSPIINTIQNLTLSQIVTNIGNWSADKASYMTINSFSNNLTNIYNNDTALANRIISIGNWTLDKTSYNTTVQLQSLFLNATNYSTLDNKINSIGNWSLDKTNYMTINSFSNNLTNIYNNDSALANRITSIGNWTLDKTSYNTTTQLLTIFATQNNTVARTGNCPAGQAVQNTTNGGVQCIAVGGALPSDASFGNLNVTTKLNVTGTAYYGNGEICTSTNGLCSASLPVSGSFTDLNVTGTFNSSTIAYVKNITFSDGTSMTTKPTGGSATVPGSDSEVAYRNSTDGSLAGANNARITGNGYLYLPNSSEPVNPGSGAVLFSENRGEKSLMAYVGKEGRDHYVQSNIAYEDVVWCNPAHGATGTTIHTCTAGYVAAVGTVSNPAKGYTNVRDTMTWNVLTSAAGLTEHKALGLQWGRGNASLPLSNGGFDLVQTFYIGQYDANTVGCWGMTDEVSAYTNATNCFIGAANRSNVFVGFDKAETVLSIYTNNATGNIPTKVFSCPSPAYNISTATNVYQMNMFAKRNGGNLSIYLRRLDNTSIAPCEYTFNSNDNRLPVATTPLGWRMFMGRSNAAPGTTGVIMGMNKVYISTDK